MRSDPTDASASRNLGIAQPMKFCEMQVHLIASLANRVITGRYCSPMMRVRCSRLAAGFRAIAWAG
jgi:hypothetical protein